MKEQKGGYILMTGYENKKAALFTPASTIARLDNSTQALGTTSPEPGVLEC